MPFFKNNGLHFFSLVSFFLSIITQYQEKILLIFYLPWSWILLKFFRRGFFAVKYVVHIFVYVEFKLFSQVKIYSTKKKLAQRIKQFEIILKFLRGFRFKSITCSKEEFTYKNGVSQIS